MNQLSRTGSHNNNFNLLRMLSAVAVLVSHSFPIALGLGTTEPLTQTLGINLGTVAVLTFFTISGYFIAQSFSHLTPRDFVIARVLRIYPALLVVLLLTVFVVGPLFTGLPVIEYCSSPKTVLYLPRNLRLWPLQYDLPGVFLDNPYGPPINGSLWSLSYEVGCYAMVAAVGTLARRLGNWAFNLFLASYVIGYVALIPFLAAHPGSFGVLRTAHFLTLPFVIGMAVFEFRKWIPLNLYLTSVLGLLAFLSNATPWFQFMFVVFWSYAILTAGFVKWRCALWYNKFGDYSYGFYIYAFPLQQIIVKLDREIHPYQLTLMAFASTLACAVASWHLIEKPARAYRTSLSAWLSRLLKKSVAPATEA